MFIWVALLQAVDISIRRAFITQWVAFITIGNRRIEEILMIAFALIIGTIAAQIHICVILVAL